MILSTKCVNRSTLKRLDFGSVARQTGSNRRLNFGLYIATSGRGSILRKSSLELSNRAFKTGFWSNFVSSSTSLFRFPSRQSFQNLETRRHAKAIKHLVPHEAEEPTSIWTMFSDVDNDLPGEEAPELGENVDVDPVTKRLSSEPSPAVARAQPARNHSAHVVASSSLRIFRAKAMSLAETPLLAGVRFAGSLHALVQVATADGHRASLIHQIL
mmetsp:Transcript_36186/g.84778  ORF Transcript_36186/g.84778 Transcript_36186/m.84778 type:complete len:214 (+) Transcript_36186:1138-1779(+)